MTTILWPLAVAIWMAALWPRQRAVTLSALVGFAFGAELGPLPLALGLASISIAAMGALRAFHRQSQQRRLKAYLATLLEEALDNLTLLANPWTAFRSAFVRSSSSDFQRLAKELEHYPKNWPEALRRQGETLALPALRQLGMALALVQRRGSDLRPALTLFLSDLHQAERSIIRERALQTASLFTAAGLAVVTVTLFLLEALFDPHSFRVFVSAGDGWLAGLCLMGITTGVALPLLFSEIPT